MLFNPTVFNRADAVNLIQATFCQLKKNLNFVVRKSRWEFWSVSEALSLELLMFRFQCFFYFFEITVFEDSFAVTGATQMAFNTRQNSAER